MKAICIPAFNRLDLIHNTLAAVEMAMRPDWCVFLSVDPNGVTDNVMFPIHVRWTNARQLGCSLNSFTVCSHAISQGAEAVLFMDDDILLSPDALDLCDWYLNRPRAEFDAGIALCRKDGNDPKSPELISARETWMGHLGQGWCFTRKQWFDFVLRYWWWYDPGMGRHDTYDWALCYMAQQLDKIIFRPRFARARHNGAIGYHGPGIGTFPEQIASGTGYKYRIE